MPPVAKERAILELLQQGTLSQHQIAVQVGCSRGMVRNICNGKRHPQASQEENTQQPPDPKLRQRLT
jgi:transcriptional regulator with XRE-family HTH domain